MNIRLILIIVTVACVSGMCNIRGMFSAQFMKMVFLMMAMVCIAFAGLRGRSLVGIKYPRIPYYLLLISFIVASFSAALFHPQSLLQSLTTISPFFMAFALFWVWMKFDVPSETIIKFLIILCLVNVPIYFCNLVTFPNYMFGEPFDKLEDISRGILRIPVYYSEIFTLILFYCVNVILYKGGMKWYMLAAICVLMIVLSVTRQHIFFSLCLALCFYLKTASWKKRIFVTSAVVGVVFVVLPTIPMYQAMVDLSETQVLENSKEDNIRITAAESYINDFQTNDITRVIGNGVPSVGNSQWGSQYESLADSSLCFYVDVGWAGFYWLFGLIAVGSLLWLFVLAAIKKKSKMTNYLTYWFVYQIIINIASGQIIYYYSIVSITIGLYLVFNDRQEKINEYGEENGNNNSKLQHIGGLAKLRRQCRTV